ncbi:MAG: branched-chain amino acid ABC transporter permease [Burkholderiales bacterium 68-10]|jgi:branched-chain amino acid transport system permease protein|nr:MAG: branched-chain amino acid ABC transporter permease [Burkholderiales bacterium 68-10]
MRFIFKTDYNQDIRLAKDGQDIFWYSCLGIFVLLAPWIFPEYWLDQLTFVLIYAIIGLGMMLITGFTGLFSLGHAAFLGVGAYTQAVMVNAGFPFPVALCSAAALTGLVGVVVGLPALRVKGIYLAMATLAFGFIVEEGMARWESVTNGNAGLALMKPVLFGHSLESTAQFYALCLFICVLCTLAIINLMRSPTGRSFVAIRDSEISAQSMGINLARYKTLAFALSAAMTGIGGALYAHKIQFLSPDQFGIMQSVDLLLLVVIGGLGSIHGAFLGAIFLITMPQLIVQMKDSLPPALGQTAGLQATVYGIILVFFVLFEPLGIYGRWVKIRTYFELFPFYREGMFKRQRSYQKSERLK